MIIYNCNKKNHVPQPKAQSNQEMSGFWLNDKPKKIVSISWPSSIAHGPHLSERGTNYPKQKSLKCSFYCYIILIHETSFKHSFSMFNKCETHHIVNVSNHRTSCPNTRRTSRLNRLQITNVDFWFIFFFALVFLWNLWCA